MFRCLCLLLIAALFPAALDAAPPANDNFSSRSALATGVAAAASTAEATLEAGEVPPAWLAGSRYQRSVWWKWTAPAAGWYQATTSGSEADTALTVSTGTALNALSLVQANDQDMRANAGLVTELLHNYELPNARVLFQATAGTEYQFAVATAAIDAGPVRVKVGPAAAPSPRITALSFSSPIDANGSAPKGTATVTIASQTPFLKGAFIAYGRANGYQSRLAVFTPAERTAGDGLNGTYTFPFNPNLRLPAGQLDWQMILEAEADSEISSYGLRGQVPVPAGLPASFAIVNSGSSDTTPPVIASFDLAPASHDITSAVKSSTVTIRATDNLAGIKVVFVSLVDATGREFDRSSQSSRSSGTATDGVFAVPFDFQLHFKLGTYTVRAWAEDAAGNISIPVAPGQAGWPGPFTGTLQVTRTTNVAMSAFRIDPRVVDVSTGPQTVTIEADVTATGPTALSSATFFLWPAMAAEPLKNSFAPEITLSSTAATDPVVRTATGWRATFTIPRGYPPGLALPGIRCNAGSPSTHFGPRFNVSFPPGSPAGITVVNDAVPDLRPPRLDYLSTTPDPKMRSGCPGDGVWCTIRITDDSTGIPDRNTAASGLRNSSFSVNGLRTPVGIPDRRFGTELDATYSIFILTENAAHAPFPAGDYILETAVADNAGRKATIARSRLFKLVGPPAAYQTWADSFYGPLIGNCDLFTYWAPYADSDQDATGTLTEAYFNTDPTDFRRYAPPLEPALLAGNELAVTWTEPLNTNGTAVLPQWSPDLISWLASGESVRGVPARTLTIESLGPAPGGTLKRVRLPVAGFPKSSLRLQPVPAP